MRSKPLLIIFFTVFLDLLGFGIIIPILPYFAERFGASPAVITLLMASYSLMQFLFAPVWGRLSDRIGRRPIILMSLAVSTAGYALLAVADTLPLVFAARILAGIGNANIPTAQAYIADVTRPEERARGMGLVGMAFGLGFVFGPALGGFLGGIAIPLPAVAAAVLTGLDLILAAIMLPEPAARQVSAAGQRGVGANVRAFLIAIERPNVGVILALFFLATFAFAQLESTFSLYIEHRFTLEQPAFGPPPPVLPAIGDHSTQRAAARATGAALFVIGVISALIQGGLIGRLTRRFGEVRLVRTGLVLLALGLALFSWPAKIGSLYPVLILIAAGSGLLGPTLQSLLSRNAAADEQGGTLGIGQSLSSLARVLGPILGGNLFEHVGIGAPYWVAAILMAGAVMLTIPLRPAPNSGPAPAPAHLG